MVGWSAGRPRSVSNSSTSLYESEKPQIPTDRANNHLGFEHLSKEHFTVDGTLIEAWASQKSFQRKDGGDDDTGSGANFHGEKRANETHASKTDPDARLYKKSRGSEAKLSYLGHVMVENRHGFIVDAMLT